MTRIIITILAAVVTIDALIVYACCVIAGRADKTAERIWRNRHGGANKPAGRDYR